MGPCYETELKASLEVVDHLRKFVTPIKFIGQVFKSKHLNGSTKQVLIKLSAEV